MCIRDRMVTTPDDFIEPLAKAGAGYICPHAETINADAFRIVNKIHSLGCKVGVVLNPATPVSYIRHYIHLLDKVTVMTVDPGFLSLIHISQRQCHWSQDQPQQQHRRDCS